MWFLYLKDSSRTTQPSTEWNQNKHWVKAIRVLFFSRTRQKFIRRQASERFGKKKKMFCVYVFCSWLSRRSQILQSRNNNKIVHHVYVFFFFFFFLNSTHKSIICRLCLDVTVSKAHKRARFILQTSTNSPFIGLFSCACAKITRSQEISKTNGKTKKEKWEKWNMKKRRRTHLFEFEFFFFLLPLIHLFFLSNMNK